MNRYLVHCFECDHEDLLDVDEPDTPETLDVRCEACGSRLIEAVGVLS